MSNDDYSKWQSSAMKMLGLNTTDITNDNQWNGYSETEYPEGRLFYKTHIVRERNRSVINEKKRRAKENMEEVHCQICGFNFSSYGEIGNDFIEVHHLKPLANRMDCSTTSIKDLIFICSNCHRIVHRLNPLPENLVDLCERIAYRIPK